jgi:hypothetical protein
MLLLLISPALFAGGVYQEPSAFIEESFNGDPPKPEVIWPDKALKAEMADILGHGYNGLRVRYWRRNGRTAWVLDEIGKEKPITTGVVVNNGRIEKVRILVFRESRGWEVRHDFFTRQFEDATIIGDNALDRRIDNISGATLSVRAVTRLARIALLLDATLKAEEDAG